MQVRNEIRFLLNDREERLADVGPGDTLLDHLRIARRLTGTKEGCAEGDCGACTVLVGRRAGDGLVYEPVNACIRMLGSLDLCHVVTVEHLRAPGGGMHQVQQALVDLHGSQCGFCTPGIVMALYALWMRNPAPSESEVEVALQGNLCRCTGYQPIIAAARTAGGDPAGDPLVVERERVRARLDALDDRARVDITGPRGRVIVPASVDDLAAALEDVQGATIVAGSTDVGLWVTKFLRDISPAIFIGHLEELRRVEVDADRITLGAAVSYDDALAVIESELPHLAEYWLRIGGWQVRAMGTVGGNIANGSPIGDTPPVLIALGARVILRSGAGRRDVALEDYFIDYGKQDRQASEFVESIEIPLPPEGSLNAAYKISKRRDEDISSVAAGFQVVLEGDLVRAVRLAFGGMAAVPKRAARAEAVLAGRAWDAAAIEDARAALKEDFAPIDDWRASAEYRARVAGNLLERFWRESRGEVVRLERKVA